MLPTLFGFTFVVSFATYSILRHFDVDSTKAFSKYLDMEKHEVNPLVNWLLKRGLSLNRSFTVMLFLFGVPIALGDAMLNTYLALGVPLFAWLFGCLHVIASANNYGYLSGTSMATPYVTGLAAVIKGAWPGLTSSQIATIIFNSTDDLGAPLALSAEII